MPEYITIDPNTKGSLSGSDIIRLVMREKGLTEDAALQKIMNIDEVHAVEFLNHSQIIARDGKEIRLYELKEKRKPQVAIYFKAGQTIALRTKKDEPVGLGPSLAYRKADWKPKPLVNIY